MMNSAPNSGSLESLRCVAIFAVTAWLCVRGLDAVLPSGGDVATEIKLEGLEHRRANCDLLVLGSSQVFRGFEPVIFDETTAGSAVPTQSFNMGMPGTTPAESYSILRRIAADPPTNLKWVLVEADGVARVNDQGTYLTAKSIAWHDLATIPLLVDYFGDLDLAWDVRAKALWRNVVGCTYHELGMGRGVPIVEGGLGLGPKEEDRYELLGPLGDGFHTIIDNPGPGARSRRNHYLANRKEIHKRWRQRVAGRVRPKDPMLSALPFFKRLEELGDSMGVQVLFYTRVGSYDGRAIVDLAEAGLVRHLLRLDDAEAYPEVLDPAYLYDNSHYNRRGSKIFSRYLAQAFVDYVGQLEGSDSPRTGSR